DESITQAWLRELQIQQTRLRQYAYTSLAQIRGWIGQPKDLPLFESRLILDSYSVDVFTQYRFKTLHLSNLRCFGDARVPLSIKLQPGSGPIIQITYHRHGFDDTTIQRIFQHLETILEAISVMPEGKIGELQLLSQTERQEILVEWNRTEAAYE